MIRRLDPKVIISIFLVSSLEITLTSGKWNLRDKFHNFCRLLTFRSAHRMIYSTISYDVFHDNFLSYETLLVSGKNIYGRVDNKLPDVFSKQVFKIAYFKNRIERAI